MTVLADRVDGVIGVDTHRDTLTAAAVSAVGGLLGQLAVAADAAGYRRLLDFACANIPGRRCFAVEGAGSYGAGLARMLVEHGEWVVEVDRPKRPVRRGGKSDALDAVRAAREALAQERLTAPRRRGDREALRVLMATRQGAVTARTCAINQLKALIVGAPEELRAELRVQLLATEAADLEVEIVKLVRAMASWLLELPGVGPFSAAQVLVSWSHAGRVRSEAAFAALAGASPIPASSGQVTRHRLNRGGDRRLNRALHTVALVRLHDDPRTRAYAARRQAEGKSGREIRRCVKRAVARQLFKLLERYDRSAVEVIKVA